MLKLTSCDIDDSCVLTLADQFLYLEKIVIQFIYVSLRHRDQLPLLCKITNCTEELMFSKYLSTTEFLDVIRNSKHQYFALQTANDTSGGPSYLFSLVKLLKFLQIRASECCSTFLNSSNFDKKLHQTSLKCNVCSQWYVLTFLFSMLVLL